MSTNRCFASDNTAGVHPEVLAAIADANVGHALAYGADRWTDAATEALRQAFEASVEVLFTWGGTGANIIGMGSVLGQHQAVLCAETAHIWNDECAAPERFLGSKLIPVPVHDGKLTCAALEPYFAPMRGVHHVQNRVLSITQPTELGTVYQPQEMSELARYAHDHGLLLHVDGARFANAAVALDVSLAEISTEVGVDILSFGGTKNGLLGAEAVIFFDPAIGGDAAYVRKQAMQLASKMRFVSSQFLAYLQNDLWSRLARHANAMAMRLAGTLDGENGVEFMTPVDCNMMFPRLPRDAMHALLQTFEFYVWDDSRSIARWVTAFDTTTEDVDAFTAAIKTTLQAGPA